MKTLAKLIWIEVKLFAREPIAVVFAFAFPLVVLLVLAGVFGSEPDANFGGVAGIDYYVPGYLAVVIASIGLIGLPVHLASLRERGVLRRLRASSVPLTSVLAAQTAVNVAMAAVGGALLLVAASLVYEVHAPSSISGVTLAFGVGTLSFVSLGFLLGSLAPTARAAQGIGLVLFFPMWLLSVAGPPRGVMTETMRQLSDVLPLTRVVTAIQEPWLGTGSNVPDLLLLAALFGAAVALSAWRNSEGAAGLAMLGPSEGLRRQRHQTERDEPISGWRGGDVMDDAREEARRWVRRKRIFYTIVVIYLALSVLWFLIDVLTGTDDWWFYWPMLGAGIIVAITAVAMFGFSGLFGGDWGRREMNKYLERRGED